jgi:hypothetical protein
MSPKRSRKAQGTRPAKPAAPLTYVAWKDAVAAELSGPVAVTERQLRQLFIKGRPPADAARDIDALHRRAFPIIDLDHLPYCPNCAREVSSPATPRSHHRDLDDRAPGSDSRVDHAAIAALIELEEVVLDALTSLVQRYHVD